MNVRRATAPPVADEDENTVTFVPLVQPLRFQACGLSNPGKVRRHNEDAFLVHPTAPLWLVADGMGGHAKGDLASGSIARAFEQITLPERLGRCADLAESTLIELNGRFRALADYGRDGVTIGSTVVALAVRAGYALLMWVGDSRIYRSRNGQFEQLTEDHSQVQEMVASGLLSSEQAESHPAANIVTRAVGAADELFVDMDCRPVEPGDRFLLCSDGLSKEVPEADIAALLAAHGDAEGLCRGLVERALSGPARDNVTVVVVVADPLPAMHR